MVLRKQPGERAPSLKKLAAGTPVVVLRVEGRWLRVRVGKAVGYLTRTTVSGVDAAADHESTGWSASRRGATPTLAEGTPTASPTGLYVEVSAETAPLRAEPASGGAVVAAVARGQRLSVIAGTRTPGWLHARDDQGHEGWIEDAHVGDGTAAAALSDVATEPATTEATSPAITPRARGRFAVRADAGIGYRSLGMDFSSNGTGGLANYLVSAEAPSIDLGVDVVTRRSPRFVIGFDGRVQLSRSSPGLDYLGPSNPSGQIGFSTLAADVGVRAGTTLRRIFELGVRGGLHYDAFLATEVENAGMLPRERLLGGTLGVRVDVTPPRSRIGVTGRFDALVVGARRQTPGLEDGTASTARAFWGGVTIRIQVARHLSLLSAYDFGSATTRWSGMSLRSPGATQATRDDRTQLVQLGISAEL